MYRFRPVTLEDGDLLQKWREAVHVRQWWGPYDPYGQSDLEDPQVSRWIVLHDERPFGFMQDYSVHCSEDHHFAYLPKGARGIDQFIGEPQMLGAGHGSAFIRIRVQVLFEAGAPVVATDPHPDNRIAISTYRKLGFEPAGQPQETKWGLILPMLAWRVQA